MRRNRIYFLLLVAFFISELASANPPGPINPENTFVFIAGVLKWQSPELKPFSDRNRKDEELYKLFLSKGVKAQNIVYLKDEEATLMNARKNLDGLLNKTTPGSTFIFYYAGHGVRAGDGPVSFANYDYMDSKGNGLQTDIVTDVINKRFKGNQVWLLADCCFSGVLIEQAQKISTSSKSVIALTSSTASNSSTGNWTFTQTIIDCLSGSAVCDRNNDQKISLNEVRLELQDAMKYRERQLSGTAFFNIPETIQFNIGTLTGSVPFKAAMYLYFLNNGKFEPARILEIKGPTVKGELYHYSDKQVITVPVSITKPIEFAEYPEGLNVQVEWKGTNYPATIKETKTGFHFIHYTGYDNSWDEWVTYDRITTADRKDCKVEWQGVWYAGTLLQKKDGRYFIHYNGYGNDWDEWVTKERIRL